MTTDRTTCPSGKRCFESVRRARRLRRGVGNRIRVYLCELCRSYHITRATGGRL